MSPANKDKWIHLSVPHMGEMELKYVKQAFDENWISTVGPGIERFEGLVEERYGLPAVALASGTSALHLALRLAGVSSGDEVLVPTLTFAASCNPILYCGAKPVFIDSEEQSMNIDPEILESVLEKKAAVGKLPKAIVVVHLFGECADMEPILASAERFGVTVIEDAAEAIGSTYKSRYAGTMGEFGVFSFNGNKIITCSGGGVLIGKDRDQIDRARHWSTQARDKDPYDLGDYWHSEIGYNYRLSNVLASIGCGQLEVLERRIQERRAVAARYQAAMEEIPGCDLIAEQGYGLHTRWLSCCRISEEEFGVSRDTAIRHLRDNQIDCRPVWKALHTQAAYEAFDVFGGERAEDFNRTCLCLPSSSSLEMSDQNRVVEALMSARELDMR